MDGLPVRLKQTAEEVRLRVGQSLTICADGERAVLPVIIKPRHISKMIELCTGASAHSVQDSIKKGYISIPGGHRVGLCGACVLRDGQVYTMRDITSAAFRIAKDVRGIAKPLGLEKNFENTLVVSPPGAGKTTLLRDLIRLLSQGNTVCVADERYELSGQYNQGFGFDLGAQTDVLCGCPKDKGVEMLLKTMSPQIIAVDEITQAADVAALVQAAYCGVGLLASAHAFSARDLQTRPVYKELIKQRIFSRFVFISRGENGREYQVVDREEMECI